MKIEISERQRELVVRIIETTQFRGNIKELKELVAEVETIKKLLIEAEEKK